MNFSPKKLSLALAAIGPSVLSMISVSFAQPLPLLEQELQRQPDRRLELPELSPTPPPSLETPSPTPVPEISPFTRTVYVTEFRFLGNTVISDEELAEIAAPYLNRRIAFSELIELRSRITYHYAVQGYTTSAAFIPVSPNRNLDENAASFAIQILEGQIEAIQVFGNDRLTQYVTNRIERAITPIFNQPKLEEALRLLQDDQLINTISATLSEGSQRNLGILSLQVEGQPPFGFRASVDNARSPTVGTVQVETEIEFANTFGLGEVVSTSYGFTEGSEQVDLDFIAPLNSSNGAIGFRFSNLDGQITEPPLDELDIEVDSRVYELSYQQPVIRKANSAGIEEFVLGVSAARLESESTIEGFPFALSAGADDEGRTRISELSLFQEYRRQASQAALLGRSEFSFGLDAFNSTMNDEGPDAQYFLWRGQFAWLKRVLDNSLLLVRGDIQLTPDSLVPLVQFGLTGDELVKGYRQGAVISDNGILGSVELRVPVVEERATSLSVVPSFNAGIGWNNGEERELDQNLLAAPGIGLELTVGNFLARLDYAVPLTDVGFEGDSFQEDGFNFRLEYQTRF